MSIYSTSIISVSNNKKINCEDMAKYLSELGQITSIISTISTHPKIEYGCKIMQTNKSKEEIKYTWEKLRDKYKFNCGHIDIDINVNLTKKYNGCILDYLSH